MYCFSIQNVLVNKHVKIDTKVLEIALSGEYDS